MSKLFELLLVHNLHYLLPRYNFAYWGNHLLILLECFRSWKLSVLICSLSKDIRTWIKYYSAGLLSNFVGSNFLCKELKFGLHSFLWWNIIKVIFFCLSSKLTSYSWIAYLFAKSLLVWLPISPLMSLNDRYIFPNLNKGVFVSYFEWSHCFCMDRHLWNGRSFHSLIY